MPPRAVQVTEGLSSRAAEAGPPSRSRRCAAPFRAKVQIAAASVSGPGGTRRSAASQFQALAAPKAKSCQVSVRRAKAGVKLSVGP